VAQPGVAHPRAGDYKENVGIRLVGALFVAAAISGVAAAAPPVTPLHVSSARTPAVPLSRTITRGAYPQVTGPGPDVTSANAALRAAVIADQRQFVKRLKNERHGLPRRDIAIYETRVADRYLSASSVVVSALLPVTREAFAGQHGGDGWLGITVRVASGTRVELSDLFVEPSAGVHALASAWKARIRATSRDGATCLRLYPDSQPTLDNYREFALTPRGIAVGINEDEACYRLVATVPYAAIASHLSPLGRTLVVGVRAPR
jgi:hypothetical protein